ncbi:MAG: right-handed parallel beta-helix repeat-containing protein [Candidatus Auribacterota bacterium]|jgi:hypothetical protein|nr:right-handed parallel beta-helix repeat-containing protein [Candidatus Auribacterota bacterium]
MSWQSIRKNLFVGLYVFLSVCVPALADDTPESLVAEGKDAFFAQGDVVLAAAKFDAALAIEETHKPANFWRAVTRIFDTADLAGKFESLVIRSNQDKPIIFGVHTVSEIDAALANLAFVYFDPTIAKQEVWNSNNSGIPINDSTGWVKHGIRFRANTSYDAGKIAVHLKRTGDAPGNITLKLCASTVDGKYPDETTVLASKSIACSEVPLSFNWVNFEFDFPVGLTDMTVYWIVLEVDYTPSSSGYIEVNTVFAPGGNWTYHSGAAWQNYTSYPYDAYYRIFEDPGDAMVFTDTFQVDSTGNVITLDYGDVADLRARLLYVKMTILIGNAYGVTNQPVQQIIDTQKFNLATFLTTYKDAFSLAGNASDSLSAAKNALISMIDTYLVQSDFIRNTRLDNDGLNHFIRFYNPYNPSSFITYETWQQYKTEMLFNEQDKRQTMENIRSNLLNPGAVPAVSMAFPDNEGDPELLIKYEWNLSAFFNTPINLDQYIDAFVADGTYVQGDYFDVTINGMFMNFTVADWNHLKGNASHFDMAYVEWENDASCMIVLQWAAPSPYTNFIAYRIYRSTSPDVDDTSQLIATIDSQRWFIDDNAIPTDGVYYYRIYTYYMYSGIMTSTYTDTMRVFMRAYIDIANAGDPNQAGTKDHPYSKFTETIEEKLQVGARVYVAEGTYYGTTISTYIFYDNLHIYGGYESGTWTRDITNHKTIVDGSGLNSALHMYGTTGVLIDGITVEASLAPCGNGITMNSTMDTITGNNMIKNCTIRDVASIGIGIWYAETVFVDSCEIDNSGTYGIQAYFSDNVVIDDCTVTNSGGYGISIQTYSDTALVQDTTVANNGMSGFYVYYSDSVYINRCTVKDNIESGIYIEVAGVTVSNSLISNNEAEGITCWNGSEAIILNNTVVQNGGVGGMGYVSSVYSLGVFNNIFAFNNAGWGQAGIYGAGVVESVVIKYNNSYGNTGGNFVQCGTQAGSDGNISVDPLFYNPDSLINPIYRLAYGSPCIDVADNDSYSLTSTDLDQSLRIVNGVIDMGAYEYLDTDNDGMPDKWEADHGLDHYVNDADDDPDNDGQSNHDEYLTGSHPKVWNADPPAISNFTVSSLGGDMPIRFTLTDIQGDLCSVEVQYKQAGGVYLDATVTGDVTDITSNRVVNLIWNSNADIPDAKGEYYSVRVRPYDATGAGQWQEYGPLWVLNNYEISMETCLYKIYSRPGDLMQIAIKLKNVSEADIVLAPMVIFSADLGQFQGTVHEGTPFTLNADKRETNIISVYVPTYLGEFAVGIYLIEDDTDHLKGFLSGGHNIIVVSQDTDNDGMPDAWEVRFGTDHLANDAEFDCDGDAMPNYLEFIFGTDPILKDSDNDGQWDGHEYIAHTNPIDPESLLKIVAPGGVIDIGEDGVIGQLTWTFEDGVVYRIYWTDNLAGTWHAVDYTDWQNDVQDNGDGTKTWTYGNQDDLLNQHGRFFKIQVVSE